MASNSNQATSIPVFNGEHCHIWVVKIRFYLRSLGLWWCGWKWYWTTLLATNPSLAQIRAHEDEKWKKDRAITCLRVGLTDSIFTKIMNLQTPKQVWDKLQCEYEGRNRVRAFRLLTCKKEFELTKMKDSETVCKQTYGLCQPNQTVRGIIFRRKSFWRNRGPNAPEVWRKTFINWRNLWFWKHNDHITNKQVTCTRTEGHSEEWWSIWGCISDLYKMDQTKESKW